MISDDDIEQIKEAISMQINLGDEFEGTSEALYLQENFNDVDNLPILQEMLTSSLPSSNLHIFSFNKIGYIVQNYSEDWNFNDFDRISQWIIDYIATFSDLLENGPKLMLESLTNCYITIVRAATAKYSFFQDFWNSMAQFTKTVYTNKESESFASLYVLRQLLDMKDDEQNGGGQTDGANVKSKSDTQMRKNRQTVFNYAMQILEICFTPNPDDGSQGDTPLTSLALDTALACRELVSASNFRTFFAYACRMKDNEDVLKLCEFSLADGKEEIDESEVDTDAVIAVEEGIVEEENNSNNNEEEEESSEVKHYILANEGEMNLVYYTNFVEILRQRKAVFSIGFILKLEAFASDIFDAGALMSSPDASLNLASFFALYEGDGYEKPSERVGYSLLTAAASASGESRGFSEIYGVGRPNEERLTSLISLMHRFTFPKLMEKIKGEMMAIFELKKSGGEQAEKASLAVPLFVRIIEQSVRLLVRDESPDFVEEFVSFVMDMQSDFLVPELEQRARGESELHFTDDEVLAFLMFDSFFAEADEYAVLAGMPSDMYGDATRLILKVSHAALSCFGADSQAASTATGIIDAVCGRKTDMVLIDNDWMLEDENRIAFDVSTVAGFRACASFSESLFFHELKQVQPRIEMFLGIALSGIDALAESLVVVDEEDVKEGAGGGIGAEASNKESDKENDTSSHEEGDKNDSDAAESERLTEEGRLHFVRILADVSGVLHAFERFCTSFGDRPDSHDEEETVFGSDSTDDRLSELAVAHGSEITGLLFPSAFDALATIAEAVTKRGDDEITATQFAIFATRATVVLRHNLFDAHSTVPHQAFKRLAPFACKSIRSGISHIRAANSEESGLHDESADDYFRLNSSRAASRLMMTAALRLAAGLLNSDAVSFGAFLVYNDESYSDLVFAAADAVEFFGVDSVTGDGSGDEFGIKHATVALLSSLYARHVSSISQRPGFERFDDFFSATLPIVGGVEGGLALLRTLVQELAKISCFNNGACVQCIAVCDVLDPLITAAFDMAFLRGDREAGLPRLFGLYTCVREGFAASLVSRVLSSCPIMKRAAVSKILDDIVDASDRRSMEQTIDLFEKLHKVWFNS